MYAGRLAEETNISKTAIMTQLETAVKRAGSKHRWEKKQQALKSGEMNQINVPYSAGAVRRWALPVHSSGCWRPYCGSRTISIWCRGS